MGTDTKTSIQLGAIRVDFLVEADDSGAEADDPPETPGQ